MISSWDLGSTSTAKLGHRVSVDSSSSCWPNWMLGHCHLETDSQRLRSERREILIICKCSHLKTTRKFATLTHARAFSLAASFTHARTRVLTHCLTHSPPVLETDRTVKSSQRAVGKYYLFYSPSQERFRHFPSQEGSTRIFPRKDVFPRIIIIILISILIILVIFSLTARIQRSFQTRLTGDVNVK